MCPRKPSTRTLQYKVFPETVRVYGRDVVKRKMLEPEQFDVTGEKSEGGLGLTKSQVRRSAKAPQLLHSQGEFIQ